MNGSRETKVRLNGCPVFLNSRHKSVYLWECHVLRFLFFLKKNVELAAAVPDTLINNRQFPHAQLRRGCAAAIFVNMQTADDGVNSFFALLVQFCAVLEKIPK